eukprot:204091-Prymnesium_polylepis.1
MGVPRGDGRRQQLVLQRSNARSDGGRQLQRPHASSIFEYRNVAEITNSKRFCWQSLFVTG